MQSQQRGSALALNARAGRHAQPLGREIYAAAARRQLPLWVCTYFLDLAQPPRMGCGFRPTKRALSALASALIMQFGYQYLPLIASSNAITRHAHAAGIDAKQPSNYWCMGLSSS